MLNIGNGACVDLGVKHICACIYIYIYIYTHTNLYSKYTLY